jgi:hypothetical protein
LNVTQKTGKVAEDNQTLWYDYQQKIGLAAPVKKLLEQLA